MTNQDRFPSEENPFVAVGEEVWSVWPYPNGNHSNAARLDGLGVESAYAAEAIKQDHSGHIYWTRDGLHVSTGEVVAEDLGEATQLLLAAHWITSGGINWAAFSSKSDKERADSLIKAKASL